MRGLVIGGGSIGKRHLENLRLLGVDSLSVSEPSAERRTALASSGLAQPFADLDQALAWKPDFVVVASPTQLHGYQALRVASLGISFFVEKPLSHSLEHLEALRREVEARRLVTLVGCNMRFHPGPRQVKALLAANTIGRVLFGRVHTGSYLPEWRPGTDYRKSYSANANMGGGCLLDCIHEIDLARWYLGPVSSVFCLAERIGDLEIDVEDIASLVCRHQGGSVSEIHLDYLQRSYERGCQIVGEQGSVFWDFRSGEVRRYDATAKSWETFGQPPGWSINQMYVDEMEHFLGCVREGRQSVQPIRDGIDALKIVLAAKRSSRSERCERTAEAS